MKHRDRAALVFTCLGFGGLGMAIIMCLLIGFGFHTTVGKEALYTAFVLQALNLAVARWREIRFLKGRAAPTPSKKMRRLRLVATWLWCAGAVFLVASLILAVCGMHFGNFWVKLPCTFGAILAPLGWLGLLVCFRRRRQAAFHSDSRSAE